MPRASFMWTNNFSKYGIDNKYTIINNVYKSEMRKYTMRNVSFLENGNNQLLF